MITFGVSNKAKQGRKKLTDSEKMKHLSVSLEPSEKQVLMLEAYRYHLTLSKFIRVLLTNSIDISYRRKTVMTVTDSSQYFMLWGQRFIVFLGTYYEAMVRFGFLDNNDLKSLLRLQENLPITFSQELQQESEVLRTGTLKFNVPSALREAIEEEAKASKITMSEFVRRILREYIKTVTDLQRITTVLSESERDEETHKAMREELHTVVLRLGRQASQELAIQASSGRRPNEDLAPVQLQKQKPEQP